jgi:hypothetical protein
MLQAKRSWARFLTKSFNFFNVPNPSRDILALGLTQHLTEISTRNIPGGLSTAGE